MRNLQEGRYNPTALHLNLVLSLTPSQKFILICFWYLENLKIIFIIPELERAIKDLLKQVSRNILQLLKKLQMAVLTNPNHLCWWKDINPHKVKS